MSEAFEALSPKATFGSELRDVVRGDTPLARLPLACARIALGSAISVNEKRQALRVIHDWTNYAEVHGVSDHDPYTIRRHITAFAKEHFSAPVVSIDLLQENIECVGSEGQTYSDILSSIVSPEILYDRDVALYGGTARLALKMLAGVDISSELPLHDVDAIFSTDANISDKAHKYTVELTGAKMVEGDIESRISTMLANVDCTMNQVAIHNGKLIYTEQALSDIQQGIIRPIIRYDSLFGADGVVYDGDKPYIDKKNIYRGLSFLLRGKGNGLAISRENLEQEKYNIGRYWQILLLVKLLPMKDSEARYRAIGHWHDIARRLEVTETESPASFFTELSAMYPETRATNTVAGTPNMDSQVRWIAEKLVNRGLDKVFGASGYTLPETYTPYVLRRSDTFQDYDMHELIEAVRTSGHAGHV